MGILLHVTSLPSGDFSSAHAFVDFLRASGVRYWQTLAFGPTGYGDSPYSTYSVFALNPHFLGDGAVEITDEEYKKFVLNNKFWCEEYAAFTVLKEFNGGKSWQDWDKKYRDFSSPAVLEFIKEHQTETSAVIKTQAKLFKKWDEIKNYANTHGVKIIGDLPIYPAMDSADVWAKRGQFEFAGETAAFVSGVGADYFNAEGQLWGTPVYNFKQMATEKFAWWAARIKLGMKLFDVLRLDHFRAFDTYYKIPFGAASALCGTWAKGPGMKFFNAIKRAVPNAQIILEDLGELSPSVYALRDAVGYAGMRVAQFGFDGRGDNIHLPRNYPANCVAYIGTHDNDTAVGFIRSQTRAGREIVDKEICTHRLCANDVARVLTEEVLGSAATIAVVTMQDLLLLDTAARMNTPGTVGGNWAFKIETADLSKELCAYVKLLTGRFGR
jgi:4-alpha-glucanotransferase